MFGIDSSELAVIALVALLVIGPKDLPRVMRMVGQWVSKGRAMTRHVRAGFDTMMREAEMAEMQKAWAEQNEAIMKATALPDLSLDATLPDLSSESWTTPTPPLAPDVPVEKAAPKPRRRARPVAAEAAAEPAAEKPRRKRAVKPKPVDLPTDS